VGPVEDSTRSTQNQEHGGRKHRLRRPRTRRCLLKGCGQRFRPVEVRDRYCSQQCRQAARQWSRWKAQQSYRATAAGKEKRNGQSRRYRERVKERKPARQDAVPEVARVITKSFFRPLLRPSRLLRGIRIPAAITTPALLFGRMPARHGTRLATGAALASCGATAVEKVSRRGGR
jgi:hypothetical protein